MLRLILAFPLALLLSYSLVGMMAWLVDINVDELESEKEPFRFDFIISETEQVSQRKSRELPKPPAMIPMPSDPLLVQSKTNRSIDTPTIEPMPTMNLDVSVSDINLSFDAPIASISQPEPPLVINNLALAQLGQTQQAIPLHRVDPYYPRKALQRRIEGYVVISFDIGLSGKPENINIEEADPARVFNREALNAIKRWKYQPLVVNGVAQKRRGQRVKLEFRIQ